MKELLSPAGNREALLAAIKNGADAVYLGLTEFSARAGADNFEREALREAVSLCGKAGVKIYVTLNTLIRDRERPQMESAIRFLAQVGVDGIIVQDLATAALARSIAPSLTLHGSTQMCVYSLSGAKALEQLGFTRVVLARELSLEEIRHIAQNTALEIEVFVHGALCMCYSGHCYFSAVVGRNSGNRGRCAQPCRLPYEGGYPLSLKDLSLLTHIDELIAAGVDSFKIEGRLKSPTYVGAVTRAAADALAGQKPDEDTIKQLEDIFSRDGFTDGYLTGQTGPDMFGTKKKTEYADFKAAMTAQQERRPFKRFSVDITLKATVGAPTQWCFTDGTHTVSFAGDMAQCAQSKPLTRDALHQRLDKLTDTHYTLGECTLISEDNIFLPVSAINEARRTGCTLLDNQRAARPTHPVTDSSPSLPDRVPHAGGLQVLYHSMSAFSPDTDHTSLSVVWLPAREMQHYTGENRGAHIDHFYPDDQLASLIDTLQAQKVRRVLVGNIGHIGPFLAAGFEVWGDYGLNITGSLALAEYARLGLKNATLSFELSLPQIRDIHPSLPTTIIAYGRLPLMQFKNCIIRQKSQCLNQQGFAPLTDRKGHTFLLSCRPDCGNTLFNSLPLYLESELLQGFESIDKRLCFTDEAPQQVQNIIHHYATGTTLSGHFTKGLYARGVL